MEKTPCPAVRGASRRTGQLRSVGHGTYFRRGKARWLFDFHVLLSSKAKRTKSIVAVYPIDHVGMELTPHREPMPKDNCFSISLRHTKSMPAPSSTSPAPREAPLQSFSRGWGVGTSARSGTRRPTREVHADRELLSDRRHQLDRRRD